MPTHVVKQGECLSSIARGHGFADWKAIYDHPQNAGLKRKRPNPHLLFPGDEIFIPEKAQKTVTVQTGKALKIGIEFPRRELRLRLLDGRRRPLAHEAFTAEGGGEMAAGETDGEGILVASFPSTARLVRVFAGGRSREVRLGDLNPMEDAPDSGISGVQARLLNLGYHPGAIDGKPGPRTRQAIIAFESDHGLEASGEIRKALVDKLKEVHGS